MKNRKRSTIILLAIGSFILMACEQVPTSELVEKEIEKVNAPIEAQAVFLQIGDDLPVSRGMVAKMLAFLMYDKNEINVLDREIEFLDTDRELWFDRYINAAVISGQLSGVGDTFLPDETLSMSQAQILLDRLIPDNTKKMNLEGNENTPISYALWMELYVDIIDARKETNPTGIFKETIIVLATPENNSQLKPWHMITNKGLREYPGLHMAAYVDKEIMVLSKGEEVIGIVGVEDTSPILESAYLLQTADMGITVFAGGVERTYLYENEEKINKKHIGSIVDIKISDGKVLDFYIYSNRISGTIKKIEREFIEIEGVGVLSMDYNLPVYQMKDGLVKYKNVNNLTVGSQIADLLVTDSKVVAAIIMRDLVPDTIRVAINNTGFTSLYHDEVIITANEPFTISFENDKVAKKAGDEVVLQEEFSEWLNKGRVTISTANDGKIQIKQIKRNWSNKESPWYRGTLEIMKEKEGYTIINELSMESYLYGVVPSEMPTSHGLEAAKVQAITARSYAVNQVLGNRYKHIGAHADDSVSSQVYNNIPENELSIEGVNATKGDCLTFEGEVVSTNFFSTSAGVTANSGEVWANSTTKEFPSPSASYLVSVPQHLEEVVDLSVEENAREFFTRNTVDAYDNDFPWFRWKVYLPIEIMNYWINDGLAHRFSRSPNLILTKQADGTFRSRPIEGIGQLLDFSVVERSTAGNIMTMEFVGTEATIRVHSEYNIRYFLKPQKIAADGEDMVITRKDNSIVRNYSLLPSAFMVFDLEKNDQGELTGANFIGGGNGHGVGMSQNGVKGMINQGYSATEILSHYYQGTVVEKRY